MRVARLLAIALVASLLVPAIARSEATAPVYDSKGRLVETPFVPAPPPKVLTEDKALALALANPKIHAWLARYPAATLTKQASYDDPSRSWKVMVWSGLPGAG